MPKICTNQHDHIRERAARLRAIVKAKALGLTNAEIGRRLNISRERVRVLYKKWQEANR